MLFKDRVKETTTTTGTGNLTTAGAATGFITFNTAFGTGSSNKFQYVIDSSGGSEWEVGVGYMSASTTLVRDTILASSNSGSAVNFSSGTKTIRCTGAAKFFESQALRILSTTTVDSNTGTKQTLFTVPTGKVCLVFGVVLRNASADFSGYYQLEELVTFGFNAGATDVFAGTGSDTNMQQLTGSTKAIFRSFHTSTGGAGSTATELTVGAAADTFGVIFGDTTITATLKIDVFGYLYDA